MATLTVGNGKEYATIAAAVAASTSGDTVAVDAGTYNDDFVNGITHDLSLVAVGGTVFMTEDAQPGNGKAIIDEGAPGVTVSITGFDISGVTVNSGNGAGIRYEAGTLHLSNVALHDDQDGLLTAPDPNGVITIDQSRFYADGAGDGRTHGIYVGAIAALTVQNSTFGDISRGNDIKSRAASNVIIGNTIEDGIAGTSSYDIDLPNGGAAVIRDNVIAKGANATNSAAISFGEEGLVPGAANSIAISGNTIINDDPHVGIVLINDSSATPAIGANTLSGYAILVQNQAPTPSIQASDRSQSVAIDTLTSSQPGAAVGLSAAPVSQQFSNGSQSALLDELAIDVSHDAAAGKAAGTLTVSLRADAGGAPGAVLATLGTIDDATLPTAPGSAVELVGLPAVTLDPGARYWVSLTDTGAGDAWSAENAGSVTNATVAVSVAPQRLEAFEAVACFVPGTLIAAERGERPVEAFAIGDLVRTASGDLRPVRWIGRRAYAARFAAANPAVAPVRIRAGALDGRLPRRDLLVSPTHAMAIDGCLVPAALLVNGAGIVREPPGAVAYVHLELADGDLLLAEGAACESFVDDESRGAFQNAADYTALYGADAAGPVYYAARLGAGWRLEHIRRRLAGQALVAA